MKTKLIFLSLLMVLQWNCKTEYKNAPELCLIALARTNSLLEKDLEDLNSGKISEARYMELRNMRESGAFGLCMVSLLKREQNGNF
ncbi:hypothetical protein [Leptospira kanakyensis]|uniref:hypothetical protein n=1 Tax=Leptospira kanakyensis TaxID=2484968 RepID=UPI00223D7731|nr:hypothetical protein [Leptospira kanakyensis]MCW7470516.1 hypothetical protein [Leptospira kanakyensis]